LTIFFKVNNIFNSTSRETKNKLAQARSKNFGGIRSRIPIEIRMQTLRLFSATFSKSTFWTCVVYDLDGRI